MLASGPAALVDDIDYADWRECIGLSRSHSRVARAASQKRKVRLDRQPPHGRHGRLWAAVAL
jgi:hypothetical protein